MLVLQKILFMLLCDLVFVGILLAVLIPLAQNRKAAFAVLKRNFVGYFSNPTGYVFLCLFVLLTSLAAFWPPEFFVSNMANLDQLNKWLPQIMLIFIPAITMSIWAEERRQGTDELLLTLPATDFDIVIGKYLAAVLIFTCSLLFSQICTFIVLGWLAQGNVDTGLFFTTYFGYWFIGLAMLAVGMVASFLTNNLTVGFILGLAFNAPLAFANYLTAMVSDPSYATWLTRWSLSHQFDDFGRGVISLASISFFVLVTGIFIYVSMILIGSRHWYGGKDGQSMIAHYLVRGLALFITLAGINVALSNWNFIRRDMTEGKVSSISPDTKRLIRNIDSKHTVVIDAFLSREVPEDYVSIKYTIISMLKELQAAAPGKIKVNLHSDIEAYGEEASLAQEQFGIRPTPVRFATRGAIKDQDIILGAAVSCGLERQVIPFFDYGVPVEYELARSISIAARGARKVVGLVETDAKMQGGFEMAGGMMPRQIPKQAIVAELEKQYTVEQVNPAEPIDTSKYDALMVVQPSSLGPLPLSNVAAAIAKGIPTAIFEDPAPRILASAVGTNQPKQAQGGMFGGGQPPEEKGDIRALWDMLGIQPIGDFSKSEIPGKVVWQTYNPYPRLQQITGLGPELVFIRNEVPGARDPLNSSDPITSGLEEVLFPFPGAIQSSGTVKDLEFIDLVTTSETHSGTIDFTPMMGGVANEDYGVATGKRYVLAARIQAKPGSEAENKEGDASPESDTAKEGDADKKGDKKDEASERKHSGVNVVYVADIDLLDSQFVAIRAGRDRMGDDFDFHFDNVTFVLNIIDSLAGDDRFIEIRKRKPRFATLELIEEQTQAARAAELNAISGAKKKMEESIKTEEGNAKKAYADAELKKQELDRRRAEGEQVDPDEYRAVEVQLELLREAAQRRLEVTRVRLQQENERTIQSQRRITERQVQGVQNLCKFWAVFLPPIPPLVVGLFVFMYRRLREREGIAKTRRR